MKKIINKHPYPPESQRMDTISHLEELRKRIILILAIFALISIFLVSFAGQYILLLAKKPLAELSPNLIFIGPTEAFAAYMKLIIVTAFILSFPIVLWQIWSFCSPGLTKKMQKNTISWIILSLFLFFIGIIFAYLILIPAALSFLLGFGKNIATPSITLGKYISFIVTLILVSGLVFELPVAIGLLTDLRILKSKQLQKNRHYSLIIILIVAAVATPTQDIINMTMLALPMFILYEIGIAISKIIERKRNTL